MKLKTKYLKGIIAASIALSAVSGFANAAIYNFSFGSDGQIASTIFSSYTDVGGTVSGTIELPDGDGTFSPLSVIIGSFSQDHGNDIATNLIATTWTIKLGTGFTVSGGAITAANWAAQNGSSNSDPLLGFDQIRFNFGGLNAFTLTGDPGKATITNDGFSGITYSAAIPEPSAALLLGGGMLGLMVRRKRNG